MRRKIKMLGPYGIFLIIIAGIFQLTALSLDQAVIQFEDKYRETQDINLKNSQEQEFALETNRKIGQNIETASFQLFVLSSLGLNDESISSNLKESKDFFYADILMRQMMLINDVFTDDNNRSRLCKKIWTVKELGKEDNKKVNICDHFEEIRTANLDFYTLLRGLKPGKHAVLNEKFDEKTKYVATQVAIQYNEYYFNDLLNIFGEIESELFENINKTNLELYDINQKKQIFLLFSMISQLLSFLFLLILFRRILSK